MTGTATASTWLDRSPAERLASLGSIDFPTKKDDAWRYAPHDALGRLNFGPVGVESSKIDPASAEVDANVDEQMPTLDGPRIVIVNGVVDAGRSLLVDLPEGLRISTLAEAGVEQPGSLANHFERTADGIADRFEALNLAFTTDGALIQVAEGVQLDAPIHVVTVLVPGAANDASCTGVIIDLGVGSSATVVETRIGSGAESGGSSIRTTITVGDDATLDHLVLQDLPSAQIHLGHVEVTQGAGSTFRARSFNLGAHYGRVAYNVKLAGVGALVDLTGLYFGFGDQTLDQQIEVVHEAKDCISRQSFRGVLDDESTGVFNGGIDVRPGADGTDAEQSNANLLLSKRAEVNTQPRLEILADDVACKHGATVGQLDDMALYYLRSRGIAAEDAQRLLINGFADQVVDDVESEVLRTWIIDRLGRTDA